MKRRAVRQVSSSEIASAVSDNITYAGCLRQLGLNTKGRDHGLLKERVSNLGLDTSHFRGRHWAAGKKLPNRVKPLSHYLVSGKATDSTHLKKRLIGNGVKEHMCEYCKRTSWNDGKIPLELHHRDGDRYNNVLDNIELLCPNCHALTDTYCGKNQKVG